MYDLPHLPWFRRRKCFLAKVALVFPFCPCVLLYRETYSPSEVAVYQDPLAMARGRETVVRLSGAWWSRHSVNNEFKISKCMSVSGSSVEYTREGGSLAKSLINESFFIKDLGTRDMAKFHLCNFEDRFKFVA